jgi:hypothetical protein
MRETSNELSKHYKQSKATQGGEMKVMKKSLKIALIMAMVVSMFAGVVSANTTTDLEKLQAAGVIIGGSGLNDNSTWVRQDVAVLLSRLYGLEATAQNYGNTHGFTDVTNAYYHGFISWAKDEGYMVGRGNGIFGYGDTITAQEFATVLLRVIGINDYANAISNAASRGIMSAGTVGTAAITRGATYSSLVALLNQSVTGGGTLGGSLNLVGWTTKIVSIQLTTEMVDFDTSDQKLAFAVNGQSAAANLKALEDAGYEIEFQATKGAFGVDGNGNPITDNLTGVLDKDRLGVIYATANKSFEYKVIATHEDGTVIESDVQEVKVLDYATTPDSIDEAYLMLEGQPSPILLSSGKIASQDTVAYIGDIKITYLDGSKKTFNNIAGNWIDDATTQTITITSSKNTVALVGNDGKIIPVSQGTTVFTIKAGDATRSLPAEVVNGSRTATNASPSKNSIKLVKNASDIVVITVVDQFGDAFQGGTITYNDTEILSGGTPFFTATNGTVDQNNVFTANNETKTDSKGEVRVRIQGITGKTANGILQVKSGSTVLTTISVAISNDDKVDSYAFELVDPKKDYILDLFADKSDSTVNVYYNKYNVGGFLIGQYDFVADPRNVVSSNTNIITANNPANGIITITAVSVGTAQIQIKEGSVVRQVLPITVVDTTPKPTSVEFVQGAEIVEAAEFKLSQVIKAIMGTGNVDLYAWYEDDFGDPGGFIYTKKDGTGTLVGSIEILESTTNGLKPVILQSLLGEEYAVILVDDGIGEVSTVTNRNVNRIVNTYAIDDNKYTTTSAAGTGATFSVVVGASGITTVTINDAGTDYSVNDVFTVADEHLGDNGAPDLNIKVGSIGANGEILTITRSDVARTAGNYTIVESDYVTNGNGEGNIQIDITITQNGTTSVSIDAGGDGGFVVGDTITIKDADILGNGEGDLVLTVTSVTGTSKIDPFAGVNGTLVIRVRDINNNPVAVFEIKVDVP